MMLFHEAGTTVILSTVVGHCGTFLGTINLRLDQRQQLL
jgi:hypothetical protein